MDVSLIFTLLLLNVIIVLGIPAIGVLNQAIFVIGFVFGCCTTWVP